MRNIVPGPSVHKVSVYNVFKQSTGALLFRCQEQDSYSSAIEKLIVRLSYLNVFRFYRLLYKPVTEKILTKLEEVCKHLEQLVQQGQAIAVEQSAAPPILPRTLTGTQ